LDCFFRLAKSEDSLLRVVCRTIDRINSEIGALFGRKFGRQFLGPSFRFPFVRTDDREDSPVFGSRGRFLARRH
jgi:hypothetical protein